VTKPNDLTGHRFTRLTVIRRDENNDHGHTRWRVRCDCGEEKTVLGYTLTQGKTHSCGCLKRDLDRQRQEEYAAYRRDSVNRYRITESGCWEYTGATNGDGYGIVGGNRHTPQKFVHRLAFERARGPIPRGKQVLHRCDNPPCIRPDHLFLGTHADNMRDMARKGRRKGVNAGAENGAAKLTEAQVVDIRERYAAGGVSQQVLADEHGVHQTVVSAIVLRKIWKPT
jgi:hypothetical protein